MIITVHQPECFVHLALIDKISKANVFVIADTFQVKKNYYDNRNKIRVNNSLGWQWITIPISADNHKSFREVTVSSDIHWKSKLLSAIKQNYGKSPFFAYYYSGIWDTIKKPYTTLFEYNYDLLCLFLRWFNVKTKIVLASDLNLDSQLKSSDALIEICNSFKSTELDDITYLSGPSGKDYLELNKFANNVIAVTFHEFEHPIYKQQYEPFIPELSALDYIFNKGKYLNE